MSTRKLLALLTVCFALGAKAQVLDSSINYRLEWTNAFSTAGSLRLTTLVNAYSSVDDVATYNNPDGAYNGCNTYNTGVPQGAFNVLLKEWPANAYRKFDVSVLQFSKFPFNPTNCTYQAGDITTGSKGFLVEANSPEKTASGYNAKDLLISANNGITVRDIWRYTKGAYDTSAFVFAALTGTNQVTHTNYNYGYQPGIPNNYYYFDNFSNYNKSSEVYYKFTVPATGLVNLTTDFPETNFDTYLVLFKKDPADGKMKEIATGNDISGTNKRTTLEMNLCAGEYMVLVEGAGIAAGKFKLGVKQVSVVSAQSLAGSISTTLDTLPVPFHYPLNLINSVTAPNPTFAPLIKWKVANTGINTWNDAQGKNDSLGYLLPAFNPMLVNSAYYSYRRDVTVCNTTYSSNAVNLAFLVPDGSLLGKVVSKNGQGVKGINIYAQKTKSIHGSPQTWIDSTFTGDDGTFTLDKLYYGGGSVDFVVTAYKANHKINGPFTRRLSSSVKSYSNLQFVDSTVYSVAGSTIQLCDTCVNASYQTVYGQSCPLDSVVITNKSSGVTALSGYLDPPGAFGRFATSVTDPVQYSFEPSFKNHAFSPASATVTVSGDIDTLRFVSTTKRTVSGTLKAGCKESIGKATLLFEDVLPDFNGTPLSSCFRKLVTTDDTGYYKITLPARKYKVSVFSFTPAINSAITEDALKLFFATKYPADSLLADITTANDTVNLVYTRPPTMELVGFPTITCSGQPSAFGVFPQLEPRSFQVKIYQGAIAKNCPADNSTLTINTNIEGDASNVQTDTSSGNGTVLLTLTGGTPNVAGDFKKSLSLVFKDIYNNQVTLNRDAYVTGVRTTPGTFATVTPEIPLMVLHDPPGDQSYSYWEQNKTNEMAYRFSAAKNKSLNAWAEVKLGTKFSAGLGVTVETDIWGTLNGSVNVSSRNSSTSEAIISTSVNQKYTTSGSPSYVGDDADLFIGAALNVYYAIADEIQLNGCTPVKTQKLILANNKDKGFATQYAYTANDVKDFVIPNLQTLYEKDATESGKKKYQNSIAMWQQILENNEANKARAQLVTNRSFTAGSTYDESITTSSTKSNTLEFDMEIESSVALALGFEVGGVGASGGVTVGFKLETGSSATSTTLKTNTIGYYLADDDAADAFSVDVKKDPVYNSPVFQLIAGKASCPPEDGAQSRDYPQLGIAEPVKYTTGSFINYTFNLANVSESREKRTYALSFNPASNPNGAKVYINGSVANVPYTFSIDSNKTVPVTVTVEKGFTAVDSYEGLEFTLTDACDGSTESSGKISAFFTPQCSNITLAQPQDAWVLTSSSKNILPVQFNNYDTSKLTSITLQVAKTGTTTWSNALVKNKVDLIPGTTTLNWDISKFGAEGLPDGQYDIRMKLLCPQGENYSLRSTGIVDRKAPTLYGRAKPTNGFYNKGDVISFDYNEALDCAGVTKSDLTFFDKTDNAAVDFTVGCYQNQVVIVPINDITTAQYQGDTVIVSLRNISDMYGNGKTSADTVTFFVPVPAVQVGTNILTMNLTKTSINENSGDSIGYVFNLPANVSNDTRLNFIVSGNAVFGTDYTISYSAAQTSAAVFNGALGTVFIKKGTKQITLYVKPIGNTYFEPNKTVTITLTEGGDYVIGNTSTVTGTILNDDTPIVYTFTGNGNFSTNGNWISSVVPPTVLVTGDEIIIDPPDGGECVLDIPLTIKPGGKLTVMPGKKFRVKGNVLVQQKL